MYLLYLFCKMYSMFKHFLPKWSSRHRACERGFALRDEGDNKNTSWHCSNIPSTSRSQRSAPHRHFLQPSKGEKRHYFVFLRETVVWYTHLKNNVIVIFDAFMMGLFDRSAAPRLRLIKPVASQSHLIKYCRIIQFRADILSHFILKLYCFSCR